MENNAILIIVIFICVLLILGLIIGAIIFIVPKQTVPFYGNCTNQNECATGLVCSTVNNKETFACLRGIDQPCQSNMECGFSLVCLTDRKVCSTQPPTMQQTILEQDLHVSFHQSFQSFNQSVMKPITSLNQLI